ncbi:hypothetical protein T265_09143 [Opisthorchis viverrini]|uniref:Uncharacterized protein n=1 Tax=Opisthorchis viverrini TaxID=6198 RepID=A0A074Z6W6_OPIVI|nr:hypothetical protein T265_09143 [Opisthorchis viverrini]KER22833.1 hypothetical protein T265_09143 [Opisthorchis viverrini]
MSLRMVTKRLQINCQARRTDQQPPDQLPTLLLTNHAVVEKVEISAYRRHSKARYYSEPTRGVHHNAEKTVGRPNWPYSKWSKFCKAFAFIEGYVLVNIETVPLGTHAFDFIRFYVVKAIGMQTGMRNFAIHGSSDQEALYENVGQELVARKNGLIWSAEVGFGTGVKRVVQTWHKCGGQPPDNNSTSLAKYDVILGFAIIEDGVAWIKNDIPRLLEVRYQSALSTVFEPALVQAVNMFRLKGSQIALRKGQLSAVSCAMCSIEQIVTIDRKDPLTGTIDIPFDRPPNSPRQHVCSKIADDKHLENVKFPTYKA